MANVNDPAGAASLSWLQLNENLWFATSLLTAVGTIEHYDLFVATTTTGNLLGIYETFAEASAAFGYQSVPL